MPWWRVVAPLLQTMAVSRPLASNSALARASKPATTGAAADVPLGVGGEARGHVGDKNGAPGRGRWARPGARGPEEVGAVADDRGEGVAGCGHVGVPPAGAVEPALEGGCRAGRGVRPVRDVEAREVGVNGGALVGGRGVVAAEAAAGGDRTAPVGLADHLLARWGELQALRCMRRGCVGVNGSWCGGTSISDLHPPLSDPYPMRGCLYSAERVHLPGWRRRGRLGGLDGRQNASARRAVRHLRGKAGGNEGWRA